MLPLKNKRSTSNKPTCLSVLVRMMKMMASRIIVSLFLLCNHEIVSFSSQRQQNDVQLSSLSLPSSNTDTENSDSGYNSDVIRRRFLDEKQSEFMLGYLNKHHGKDLLPKLVETFSQIGLEKAKKNAWSGGSYVIISASIIDINSDCLKLDVQIQERSILKKAKQVTIELDAMPISRKFNQRKSIDDNNNNNIEPIDDIIRRLCRLCWIVNEPKVTGQLIQLAKQLGGTEKTKLKDNMFLNQVPHNRYVRQYFYDMAAKATLEAIVLCSQYRISNRMKLISMFPEMNPSMDSYRIGTLLEMVRAIAIKLVEQNLRVRISVQQSMGVGIFTGLPKQLGGVSKLLQMMDWESEEGEENKGINFGAVGSEHVTNEHVKEDGTKVEQDDVFIIIAPQSMIGVDSSIIGPLSDMVEKAGDRPVILINPDLTDKVSPQGQQSVRGRQDRIDFAESFKTIYHFKNIYLSGTSYFPILGTTFKPGPLDMWIAYQRRDLRGDAGEVYIPILADEEQLQAEHILESLER